MAPMRSQTTKHKESLNGAFSFELRAIWNSKRRLFWRGSKFNLDVVCMPLPRRLLQTMFLLLSFPHGATENRAPGTPSEKKLDNVGM